MKKTMHVLGQIFEVEFDEYEDAVVPFSAWFKGKSKKYESTVKCDGRYVSIEKYISEHLNVHFEQVMNFFYSVK